MHLYLLLTSSIVCHFNSIKRHKSFCSEVIVLRLAAFLRSFLFLICNPLFTIGFPSYYFFESDDFLLVEVDFRTDVFETVDNFFTVDSVLGFVLDFTFDIARVLDFTLDVEILFFEEVLMAAGFLSETVRLLLETGLRRVDLATVTFFLIVFL